MMFVNSHIRGSAGLDSVDQKAIRARARRRGVILLVCLGMLVLFTLVVLMFVISARQHKATSRAYSRAEQYEVGFEELLDSAMMQVIRGSNNAHSAIGVHSLLEDMYGYDALPGHGQPPVVVAQAANIRVGNNGPASGFVLLTVQDARLSQQNGFYNGRVLTVLDGPARMQSTRIVGYNYDAQRQMGRFQVLALKSNSLPRPGDRLVINGREFNGAGFGYNARTGYVDKNDPSTGLPYALHPNTAAFQGITTGPGLDRYPDPAGQGGADEPYDIPDFNNMALCGRFFNDTTGRWEVLIPSFHRPALINYFRNHPNAAVRKLAQQNNANAALFQRKYILRPLEALHAASGRPSFTGGNSVLASNPGTILRPDVFGDGVLDHQDVFPSGVGIWDVDNDGDGLNDSVWVDLGMPLQTSSDGRLYKPLFAVMVQDMDSRLSLSAHGSHMHIASAGDRLQDVVSGSRYVAVPSLFFSGTNRAFASEVRSGGVEPFPRAGLSPGAGRSPAAVFLHGDTSQNLLGVSPMILGVSTEMLVGTPRTASLPPMLGRYGEVPDGTSGPGISESQLGGTDFRDPMDLINHPEYPNGYARAAIAVPLLHGPAVDFVDKGFIGLDKHGHPLRFFFGESLERDHPLQLDPTRTRHVRVGSQVRAIDDPLAMADMEALLRRYDVDAQSLGGRLQRLMPSLWNDNSPQERLRQGVLTAESFHTPVASFALTSELRREMLYWLGNSRLPSGLKANPASNHVVQLYFYKILHEARQANNNFPNTITQADVDNINRSIELLVPPELVRGEPMNVNRPFGNWRDDTPAGSLGAGTVDEPGEINDPNRPEYVWWNSSQAAAPTGYGNFNDVPADYNNDGRVDVFDTLGRQLLARHLYCLMMLLKDRGYDFPVAPGENLAGHALEHYTAQRIAQWAVNAVDYRDPDSIMTPFEFDYHPFKDDDGDGITWDVDGWVGRIPPGAPGTGKTSTDDSQTTYRGLVWGCERPLLLLTESMAGHDLRLEDLANDDGDMERINDPANPDDDLDTRRRPQGWLFVEIHNPSYEPVPYEFRSLARGNNAVDLGRLAGPSADGHRRPVWQMVVRKGTDHIQTKPDTGHLSPRFPEAKDLAGDDRIVWFTSRAAYGADPNLVDKRIYYTRLKKWDNALRDEQRWPDYLGYENKVAFSSSDANADLMYLVGPGQYSLVGPRAKTRIGNSGPAADPHKQLKAIQLLDENANSPQSPVKMVTDTSRVRYPEWRTSGNRTALIKRPMGIVINYPQSLSISEPRWDNYYPTPTALTPDLDNATIKYLDAYQDAAGNVRDLPLDPNGMRNLKDLHNPRFATVYLQRLANPREPWHVESNPYITVDYVPMDLQVYNGEYTGPAAQNEPYPTGPLHFTSRERIGDLVDPANRNSTSDYNIYRQAFSNPEQRSQRDFAHSFGFLSGLFNNAAANVNDFGRYLAGENGLATGRPTVWTSAAGEPGGVYVGDPRPGTYPWFTWNDHPFVSQYELLRVPASSPSRLLHEFHLRQTQPRRSYYNHYRDRTIAADTTGPSAGPPFGHLLNFCFSSSLTQDDPQGGPPGWNNSNLARSNFHRVLEYLRVPSRFQGTHEVLNPQVFVGNRLHDPLLGGPISHTFHPPFSKISRRRDPGLVNLNTVFDKGLTWAAIQNFVFAFPGSPSDHHWRKVVLSRQGYGALPMFASATDFLPRFNNESPTFFANPFQPSGSGYNVPLPALGNNGATAGGTPREFVEATLLRSDPGHTPKYRPLFSSYTDIDLQITGAPSFTDFRAAGARAAFAAHHDGDRNPYFLYETLTRLGNVVTTRSNVYGIWITVGFFEVSFHPTLPRATYPDGYVLSAELGADNGEIVRHRAFCIYNRATPVAFHRGEDYNVRRGIMVSKIIE